MALSTFPEEKIVRNRKRKRESLTSSVLSKSKDEGSTTNSGSTNTNKRRTDRESKHSVYALKNSSLRSRDQCSHDSFPQPSKSPNGSSSDMNDWLVSSSSLSCRSALLVVGFYQGLMIGLVLKGGKFFMKFSTKHHVGSVNSVALTDRCIASAGVDERVFLFTNKMVSSFSSLSTEIQQKMRASGQSIGVRLADLGSVSPPAEISCLELASHSQFLFCGSTEGQLLVYRTRDWSVSAVMKVHDRRLEALAVHPTSRGALVVTAGADHMLAVIDVVKEKLLTKHRYLSTAVRDCEKSKEANTKKKQRQGSQADETSDRLFSPILRRDEPTGLLFSPTGQWLLAYSRQSWELFYGAGMQLAIQYHNNLNPQPGDEIHAAILMDIALSSFTNDNSNQPLPSVESILLVGDESCRIRYLSITRALADEGIKNSEKRNEKEKLETRRRSSSRSMVSEHMKEERSDSIPVTTPYIVLRDPATTFSAVPITYPSSLQKEVAMLLANPVQADVEARTKHPLRHVSRIKALRREGNTLFSLDARGIVICWKISLNPEKSNECDAPFTLQFETSANCQGRATSMASLWL